MGMNYSSKFIIKKTDYFQLLFLNKTRVNYTFTLQGNLNELTEINTFYVKTRQFFPRY